jgi:DNA-binding IclR family transcriptional regulator
VQPYCRIDNVMEQLGVSRPTASRYLNELSEAGLLATRQVWKETLFINEALLQVLKE